MSDPYAILRRMRVRLVKGRPPREESEEDPHTPFVEAYQDYLEHARWIFEVQERRGVAFQQTALAVLGFDGVILSIVLGLQPASRGLVPAVLTGLAALLVVSSSVSAVRALLPRAVSFASTEKLVDQWGEIFEPPTGQPALHPSATRSSLAASLLSRDLEVDGAVGGTQRHGRAGKPSEAPDQPLLALEHLVDLRAGHLKRASWLLVAGLALSVLSWAAASITV